MKIKNYYTYSILPFKNKTKVLLNINILMFHLGIIYCTSRSWVYSIYKYYYFLNFYRSLFYSLKRFKT